MPQMSHAAISALILMGVAGVAISIQAPWNAALGRGLGSGMGAATVSFGSGFVVLLAVSVLLGEGPAYGRMGQVPFWMLWSGVLGAFYIWAAIYSVPVLGVLTTVATLIMGQIVGALVLDYIGAFGLAARDISPTRVLAALLVGGGVILSRY